MAFHVKMTIKIKKIYKICSDAVDSYIYEVYNRIIETKGAAIMASVMLNKQNSLQNQLWNCLPCLHSYFVMPVCSYHSAKNMA